MNKPYYEQIVLFVSIIKWAVLGSIVGVVTGISTSIFLKALQLSTDTIRFNSYYFLLLPIIFFTSSFIVKYFAPDAEGHGTEKVIEAIHKRHGKINLAVVPVKLVATVITLAGGGSAGKEGPCAQIGAGLASSVADVLRLSKDDRKKLVICGISAGFSTVFGTPLAGALFAVEVLVVGRLLNEYLFPALVSAIIGFETARYLAPIFNLPGYFHQNIEITKELMTGLYFESMLSGVFFGLVALLLIESVKYFEKLSHLLKWYKPFKGLLGGAILVVFVLMLGVKNGSQYLGLGVEVFEGTLLGHTEPALYAFLVKILFTSITLSFGGSGGILTPIFFIGATSGAAFSQIFNFGNVTLFSAIGLVALLSAATNAPISATVMAIQMFGLQIAPYAAIACIVSYTIAGHRSVYPSQVLGSLKSKSISVPLMQEFRDVKTITVSNEGSIISKLRKKSR